MGNLTNMLSFSCILSSKTKRLGFLGQSHILAPILASTKLPTYSKNGSPTCINLFHKQNFTKSCTNAIEEFHQTLGGRMFRHEKVRNKDNATCPFTSEYTTGLRPSHTNPQFKKLNMNSSMNCLTKFAKHSQLEH